MPHPHDAGPESHDFRERSRRTNQKAAIHVAIRATKRRLCSIRLIGASIAYVAR